MHMLTAENANSRKKQKHNAIINNNKKQNNENKKKQEKNINNTEKVQINIQRVNKYCLIFKAIIFCSSEKSKM